MKWPGEANVSVAIVHLAKGTPIAGLYSRRLAGATVPVINSRLRPKPERPDPRPLSENKNLSFNGVFVMGTGFILEGEEAEQLRSVANNAVRMKRYIGGEDLNTSPTQSSLRWVIDFEDMDLSCAQQWPALLDILRRRAKPDRDKQKDKFARTYWWQHFRRRPTLYAAISPLTRCLTTARVTKHLCVSFQPTDRVFSEQCYVFALDRAAHFATLQSRIHEYWARFLSSSLEDRLRYAASDCFDTFPFPRGLPALEDIGERLYTTRAAYMVDTDQGLTKTYNALKDPTCDDPRILDLRALHLDLDRAVLSAYGWSDIEVPPYPDPTTPEEKAAHQTFEDEVLDRLFTLNAQRAAAEQKLGHTRKETLTELQAAIREKERQDLVLIELPFREGHIAAGRFEAASLNSWRRITVRARRQFHATGDNTYFVGYVSGRSMLPTIPDGAYCLFRHPTANQPGDLVLVQRSSPENGDGDGPLVVKRRSRRIGDEPETLLSLNPEFRPITVSEYDHIIGDYIEQVECVEFHEPLQPE